MVLTNVNGYITFQTADTNNNPQNVTLSGVLSGPGGFTKTGGGMLTLNGTNIYSGSTTVSSNVLALTGSGSMSNSSSINIGAGGTLDVSGLSSTTFNLSSSTSLSASGTATAATIKGASGGTVNLGSQPISLTYDGIHPALKISQGTLSLNGNAFTVNNASGTALGAGTYTIIQQTSGNITSSGSYTVTITGAGLFGNATATIQVNGGNANLVVAKATPTFSGLAASQSIN